MLPQCLLPPVPGIDLQRVDIASGEVTVSAATNAPVAECPSCGTASHRVHSRYGRTLADKPLGSRRLRFRIAVRRFVCDNADCPRTIFAEPLDVLATPRARTTAELAEAHIAIGFAAGGEPGARLAEALDMPTSPDTLLRRVKAAELDPSPPPRFVGIDDWASRVREAGEPRPENTAEAGRRGVGEESVDPLLGDAPGRDGLANSDSVDGGLKLGNGTASRHRTASASR